MIDPLWTERYRPNKISDCVLPDRIKSILQSFVDNKTIPNLLLSGAAGCGKTTAALALCAELGLDHIFINASEERGIDTLRTKVVGYASTVSLVGGRKVIILDEADYLTPEAQAALRGIMEEFSPNAAFIFTCNFKMKLIEAIHSRTTTIDFALQKEEKPKIASMLFKRVSYILTNENVEFDKNAVIKIIEKYFPDNRRILNELQKYASAGPIDAGVLVQVSDIKNIAELIGYLKDKNFGEMRKWVVMNSDLDSSRIYRRIYNSMYEYLKPESIPQVIVLIAKYQFQSAFVSDPEINLVACLTEIMIDGSFL